MDVPKGEQMRPPRTGAGLDDDVEAISNVSKETSTDGDDHVVETKAIRRLTSATAAPAGGASGSESSAAGSRQQLAKKGGAGSGSYAQRHNASGRPAANQRSTSPSGGGASAASRGTSSARSSLAGSRASSSERLNSGRGPTTDSKPPAQPAAASTVLLTVEQALEQARRVREEQMAALLTHLGGSVAVGTLPRALALAGLSNDPHSCDAVWVQLVEGDPAVPYPTREQFIKVFCDLGGRFDLSTTSTSSAPQEKTTLLSLPAPVTLDYIPPAAAGSATPVSSTLHTIVTPSSVRAERITAAVAAAPHHTLGGSSSTAQPLTAAASSGDLDHPSYHQQSMSAQQQQRGTTTTANAMGSVNNTPSTTAISPPSQQRRGRSVVTKRSSSAASRSPSLGKRSGPKYVPPKRRTPPKTLPEDVLEARFRSLQVSSSKRASETARRASDGRTGQEQHRDPECTFHPAMNPVSLVIASSRRRPSTTTPSPSGRYVRGGGGGINNHSSSSVDAMLLDATHSEGSLHDPDAVSARGLGQQQPPQGDSLPASARGQTPRSGRSNTSSHHPAQPNTTTTNNSHPALSAHSSFIVKSIVDGQPIEIDDLTQHYTASRRSKLRQDILRYGSINNAMRVGATDISLADPALAPKVRWRDTLRSAKQVSESDFDAMSASSAGQSGGGTNSAPRRRFATPPPDRALLAARPIPTGYFEAIHKMRSASQERREKFVDSLRSYPKDDDAAEQRRMRSVLPRSLSQVQVKLHDDDTDATTAPPRGSTLGEEATALVKGLVSVVTAVNRTPRSSARLGGNRNYGSGDDVVDDAITFRYDPQMGTPRRFTERIAAQVAEGHPDPTATQKAVVPLMRRLLKDVADECFSRAAKQEQSEHQQLQQSKRFASFASAGSTHR